MRRPSLFVPFMILLALALPASAQVCGTLVPLEQTGFADGVLAVGDAVQWNFADVDTEAVGADTFYVDFRALTGVAADTQRYPGSSVTVAAADLADNADLTYLPVSRLTWDPADSTNTAALQRVCSLTVRLDNTPPAIAAGCILGATIRNGNYIANDTLAGRNDTLRIFWRTTGACNGGTVNGSERNFDATFLAVWFGDFLDSATYGGNPVLPFNAAAMGYLTGGDALLEELWIGRAFSSSFPDENDTMYVDVPLNTTLWPDSVQRCVLQALAAGDTIYLWGMDDAGNLSGAGHLDDQVCLDNVPTHTELGSDILYDDFCGTRFSPYDNAPEAYYTNLDPDSILWYKDKVDTAYDETNLDHLFNKVYLIGFNLRTEPDENPDDTTGAVVAWPDYVHPSAPGGAVAWEFVGLPEDTNRTARFTWYGKQGPLPDDPPLAPAGSFWNCPNGLLLGTTMQRWMDAAGNNQILGADRDPSTDIDENYTTLNQLQTVADLCPPAPAFAGDTLRVTNSLPAGPDYDPDGPGGEPAVATLQWTGPNGDVSDDPALRFRVRRAFTQGLTDECLRETTLSYRVRVDSILISGEWTPAADSVFFYNAADPLNGTPSGGWQTITFNANDAISPVITFSWGHQFTAGQYLPDGLYLLTLEVKDPAGNVYRDAGPYIWLNGAGASVTTVQFVDGATQLCRGNFFVGEDLCVRVYTDVSATQVLVDWSCLRNVAPEADSSWITTFELIGGERVWTACMPVTAAMVDPGDPLNNIYELDSAQTACVSGAGRLPIRVQVFDGSEFVTSYDAPVTNPCRFAVLGLSGCAAFFGPPEFSFYDPDSIELNLDDFRDRVAPYDEFGPAPLWNGISPGSAGASDNYDAALNPAHDQQQDSVWIRLLLDLAAVSADSSDTLVLRLTNDMGTPDPGDDRVRELRKALFQPASADMVPDPTIDNTWYDGFLELWNLDPSVLEFRFLWNGSWFTQPGADSVMLVPANASGTVRVSATFIEGADGSECAGVTSVLRVDNENPEFRDVFAADVETGGTESVSNLRPGAACGNCYGDDDRLRLRVMMSERVHFDAADYPNEAGSHPAGDGSWPLTRGWQLSAIDLRTGEIVTFGGDTVVVQLDSVLVQEVTADSVYYTLVARLDIPAGAPLPYDSVALVIRSAWDQAGNPGRYNNPVFNDTWQEDSAEDTTFRIILHDQTLVGVATIEPSVQISGPCGDRCVLDNASALLTATFDGGEVTVSRAWLSVEREDGLFGAELGDLTVDAGDPNRFTFDFGGDLCGFWSASGLDMGCYHFTVHYEESGGGEDSLRATTTCGGSATDLVCVDCAPGAGIQANLDSLIYTHWDCALESMVTVQMPVPQTEREVGGRTTPVVVRGSLPATPQFVRSLYLWGESVDAPFGPEVLDSVVFDTTGGSAGASFVLEWNTPAQSGGTFVYPTGHYRLWLTARDAVCNEQETGDEFQVVLDQAAPLAEITAIAGRTPDPLEPDTLNADLSGDSTALRIDWFDGLVPDDSVQANNRVRVWAKRQGDPNAAGSWFNGTLVWVPAPCNPHLALLMNRFACGETYDLVAVATDEWGADADLSAAAAVTAFGAGRTVDVVFVDDTAPVTQLWGITLPNGERVPFDQQGRTISIPGGLGGQVTLNAFTSAGSDAQRVHFDYSLDGVNWIAIATDEEADVPQDCAGMNPPLPWWCGRTDSIQWQAVWPIASLEGDLQVRAWAEDACGNAENGVVYTVTIDAQSAVARVFVWLSDVHVDNLPCSQWTEPQITDSLEPVSILTLGACADTADGDAYGAIFYIKRADDHPLAAESWCALGDDSTGPFSMDSVNLWQGPCPVPQTGVWYDIAALTTDQLGNVLSWTQLLNYGQGTTWEEQWNWLIQNGYVKRFRVVDQAAPVAFDLMAGPDQTPDSSAIFLTGDVTLTATVNDLDVVAVTFAVRELYAGGAWTVIERVEGGPGDFQPVEGHWNTELLNGSYELGAFAEDAAGNMDGDLSGVGAGPTYTLVVNVDNERPQADIVAVTANGQPADSLERGETYTFELSAGDNFRVRYVVLYYRRAGGDPAEWVAVDTTATEPYTIQWTIPPQLVVGWTYELAAVATDLVHLTDLTDAQGRYLVDTSFVITDTDAAVALFTIGGQDATTVPHVHGTDVELVAHSDANINNARFVLVQGTDTSIIGAVEGSFGQTEWVLGGWDVSLLPEDTVLIGVVGLADIGGDLVAMGEDFRLAVIDHSLNYELIGAVPRSQGLLGGFCALEDSVARDMLRVRFNVAQTDPIESVRFDWKRTADPDVESYWQMAGSAMYDEFSGNWAFMWDLTDLECGLIDLRAVLSDNAVPQPNQAILRFADSVRVDNCAPEVEISNVNGDVTPEGTEIARGQVATIIATAEDVFGEGGNSLVDSVCFYYGVVIGGSVDEWLLLDCDIDGSLWQVQWNTGGLEFAEYRIRAVAWDRAGNCDVDEITVSITDELFQRAWIVGYDLDNAPACQDRIWAVSDDCAPNYTSSVAFEYSTNNGQSWISLGRDTDGTPQCDSGLDYHIWSVAFDADSVPAGAVYRSVARDEAGNEDPTPPRFRFADVSEPGTAVIFNEDLVRVPVIAGQVPWVFSVLEAGSDQDQNCFTAGALVCVGPVENQPGLYAGVLDSTVRPCVLDVTDGRVTVFSGIPVGPDDSTTMVLTRYEMAIHEITEAAGSGGWLVSEDRQAEAYVPSDGVTGEGTLWFEPATDEEAAGMIPPSQPHLTLLTRVEYIMTEGLGTGIHEPRFRLTCDPDSMPPDSEAWRAVAAYYDASADRWIEHETVYLVRDLENGVVEFYFLGGPDWNSSDDDTDCPNKLAIALFRTDVEPIDTWVGFVDATCAGVPDSTYYAPERGPTTDCSPVFTVALRSGDFVPELEEISVFLDEARIVADGQPADAGFEVTYNPVSGLLTVRFAEGADDVPPWFGCLTAGRHTVQVFAGERATQLTPFFVDRTPPVITAVPGWVPREFVVQADLVDFESAVDTLTIAAVLQNCADFGRSFTLPRDAFVLTPIPGGYHARAVLQWEQIQHLFAPPLPGVVNQVCIDWRVSNAVCLSDTVNQSFVFGVDVFAPQVTPLSPVGAALDDDRDGPANEDPLDCIDNDSDERVDEDPVNFLTDTLVYGQRPPIEFLVRDVLACGSAATGVDIGALILNIDGEIYEPADTANPELGFTIQWPVGQGEALVRFGGPNSGAATWRHYAPGEHTVTVIVPDSLGNLSVAGSRWSYWVTGGAPVVTFLPVPPEAECEVEGYWSSRTPLRLRATVREMGGANIPQEGLRVDVLRVYECNGGLCQDTLLTNAPFDLGNVLPDPQDPNQIFTLTGNYALGDVTAVELRIAVRATNELGATATAVQPWVVDVTPPWITPVTPVPGSSVPASRPVLISANFGDSEGGSIASVPGPARRTGDTKQAEAAANKSRMSGKPGLGPWRGAVTGGLDELDGHSGVDLSCVELMLWSADSGARNLTEQALIQDGSIRWSGRLAEGDYSAIVSVCDRVCNTNTVHWEFTVSAHGGTDSLPPIITSLDPDPAETLPVGVTRSFIVGFADQGGGELDSNSIRLRLETLEGDTVPGELRVDMAPNRVTATATLTIRDLEQNRYRLFAEAADVSGNRVDSLWNYVVGDPGGPGGPPASLIDESAHNYPNPFDDGSNTRFWLPITEGGGATAVIRIYDFSGQFVKDLYDGFVTTATVIEWNGTNQSGGTVANGVYLAHVRVMAGGKAKEDIVKVAFRKRG